MKTDLAANKLIDYYKQYQEQGFLIVENLFTPEECDELNQRAADVVLGKIKLAEGSEIYMEPDALKLGLVTVEQPDPAYLFKLGHQMHVSDPVFRYYAMHDRILDILTHLTGPDLKCVQSMFIDKPKKLGVGQPYHQDSHYLKTDPDTLIAVWIACDDVDVANGGLHVVPGSQHDPIHPHEKPINEEQSYYHEVHSARERTEAACNLKKGSAVFFTGRTLHRSGNNETSDRQRRAYVLHYANARSLWLSNPSARNPHLLVRGRQYPGCL
jgi:phytanoyl-CoA hydroxylase